MRWAGVGRVSEDPGWPLCEVGLHLLPALRGQEAQARPQHRLPSSGWGYGGTWGLLTLIISSVLAFKAPPSPDRCLSSLSFHLSVLFLLPRPFGS